MNHFFIGIAGGSGCGKSTLSSRLKNKYPDLIEVVHFDDYQKEESEISVFEGMKNWDHPDAINFDQLLLDLTQLKDNKEVEIMTKCRVRNPDYEEKGRIKHILEPKKIIIVEGYMVLYDERIRNLFDLKIYLDIPIAESMKRRNKITYNDESEYNNKILVPMHLKYVEPTKELADLSINVIKNGENEVFNIVYDKLSADSIL